MIGLVQSRHGEGTRGWTALSEIEKNGHSELLIVPLFPQYADATNGSIIAKCRDLLSSSKMKVNIVNDFFILFSFHG